MSKTGFKLRFSPAKISYWGKRYSYSSNDPFVNPIAPFAKKRRYLTKDEFIEICKWKSQRTQKLVKQNPSQMVELVTQAALESKDAKVKIFILQMLRGVSYPTASVILHFYDKQPYPILDYRALWSLGYAKPPKYTVDFWWEYVQYVRALAKKTKQTMRMVDCALWQYSKEHQS